MQSVRDGQVDVIVIYKIDRLTLSLTAAYVGEGTGRASRPISRLADDYGAFSIDSSITV